MSFFGRLWFVPILLGIAAIAVKVWHISVSATCVNSYQPQALSDEKERNKLFQQELAALRSRITASRGKIRRYERYLAVMKELNNSPEKR